MVSHVHELRRCNRSVNRPCQATTKGTRMSALATVSGNVDIYEAKLQLDQIREFIAREQDPEVVAEAIDRAKLAAEWAKLKDTSGEVARHALELAIVATRQLGKLGSSGIDLLLKQADKDAARWMASHSDDEFERYMKELDGFRTVGGFVSAGRKLSTFELRVNLGREIAEGRGEGTISDSEALKEWQASVAERERKEKEEGTEPEGRRRANAKWEKRTQVHAEEMDRTKKIHGLLSELYSAGDTFSVGDVVDDLLDSEYKLEVVGGNCDPRVVKAGPVDPAIRAGVAQAVRASLSQTVADDALGVPVTGSDGNEIRPPQFVTYEDDEAGWIRVPFSNATIAQLVEMAKLRRKQAEQMLAKAEMLEQVVGAIEEQAHEHGPDKVGRLWTRARIAQRARNNSMGNAA